MLSCDRVSATAAGAGPARKGRGFSHVGVGDTALKAVSFAAVLAMTVVSVVANARFGMTLGAGPLDRCLFVGVGIAADLLKFALPLLVLRLWANRRHILAVTTMVLWSGCVAYSAAAALGFAVATRSDVVVERIAEAQARRGWEATVQRAEDTISILGTARPVSVVEAELATTIVPPLIWQRTAQCRDLTLPGSRRPCEPVMRLRVELARAHEVAGLEKRAAAGRSELATAPVAGLDADPQAAALSQLLRLDEPTIRASLALLLALLVEVASAVGFTILSVASAGVTNPTPATAHASPKPATAGTRYAPALAAEGTSLERWVETRLSASPAAAVRARAAYLAFTRWCQTQGVDAGSETKFGRSLTAHVAALGGRKARRRSGTFYEGVAVADLPIQPQMAPLPISTKTDAFQRGHVAGKEAGRMPMVSIGDGAFDARERG